MTTLIIARTFDEASYCAQMMSLRNGTWQYVMNAASTYGVRNCLVIKYGNYYFNKQWIDINAAIEVLKAKTPIQELFVV